MSTENTGAKAISAEPGQITQVPGDLSRAREAAIGAQLALTIEERRLAGVSNRDPRSAAEQERRIEEARRDLDAAEAFEESLANGEI